MKYKAITVIICIIAAAVPSVSAQPSSEAGGGFSAEERAKLETINLPAGFSIDYYAKVPQARSLTNGPEGVVFVGTRKGSEVYALVNEDGDGRADEVITLARGLNSPNGVAYKDGDLYVAEIGYRVMMVSLDGNRAVSYEPFAAGWLDKQADSAWGRPVDVLVMPDGSLLVSDDTAGYVYRISYGG